MDEKTSIMSTEQSVSDISLHISMENYSTDELFSDEDLTEMMAINTNSSYPTHSPMETLLGISDFV